MKKIIGMLFLLPIIIALNVIPSFAWAETATSSDAPRSLVTQTTSDQPLELAHHSPGVWGKIEVVDTPWWKGEMIVMGDHIYVVTVEGGLFIFHQVVSVN